MKAKFSIFLLVLCLMAWAVPSFADTTTAGASAGALSVVKFGDSINPVQVPTIVPQILPGLNNGSIGEYTAQLYHFSNPALTPLSRADVIVKVLDVYAGHWYSHITLDELEVYLLDKAEPYASTPNVRFTVYFKGRITGGGMNLGGGGAVASATGNMSGGGQAGLGYYSSTFDPTFMVTFYQVVAPKSVVTNTDQLFGKSQKK